MKPKQLITVLIILLALGLLVYFKVKTSAEDTKNAKIAATKLPYFYVTAYVVKPGVLDNEILSSGTAMANEEVEIRPEVSGKITSISFNEGSHVSKGDMLLTITNDDLKAQVEKLGYQLELAKEQEQRQKKLLAINGISQSDYDIALNAVNTTKADKDLAEAQLEKTEIKAPFDGIIGLRSVSVGSYASPTVNVATIEQTDPLKIDFSIPEKYMTQVHKGDTIHFTVSGSDKVFFGAVYAIEPKVDLSTRTLEVRALCPNKDGKIFPGAFAQIKMTLHQTDNAILIPTQAVVPELKANKVFVLKNGKAQPVQIETGYRTDSVIEVKSGLNPGDSVIITGIMQLKPGAPVKILSNK